MLYQNDRALCQFLEGLGHRAEQVDIAQETAAFLANLRQGLDREQEDMYVLPSYILFDGQLPRERQALVMDAGGSNLRAALVRFDAEGQAEIQGLSQQTMPGVGEDLNQEAFYDRLLAPLLPLLGESRELGLCFSFVADIQPNRDGLVRRFSKEIDLPEVEGTYLGEGLKAALRRQGLDDRLETCVLNDTTAALLGGVVRLHGGPYSSYIGFILGTGTNTAYMERLGNLGKLDAAYRSEHDPESRMLINMESGTYAIQRRSEIDRSLDARSQLPGDHLFEKMLSGRYKAQQLELCIEAAAQAGLLSAAACRRLERGALKALDSRAIDDFLRHPQAAGLLHDLAEGDQDLCRIYGLIENMEERQARLITANLAATLEQCAAGRSPLDPVALTIDGSSYSKSWRLRHRIDYYIEAWLRGHCAYYVDCFESRNSNLLGSALAVLSGC